METKIYRNACPRNCYGTCSMLSYVNNGKLIKVTGDPEHGYTQGHLCAKGYAYTQYTYNPLRIKYPLLQTPRGSGNWKRITWGEAYEKIANKILELNERYGSNLACGFNKFSGNLGLLHYAVEGMFNSIGPHTKPVGNLCVSTGEEAMKDSFENYISPDPEDMTQSKLIVIWGANPAVTNIHQMKFIYQAKRNGAPLVVIDPVYTETAQRADIYVQIKPGTDEILTYGIAKLLLEKGDVYSASSVGKGWESYKKYIEESVDLSDVCHITGVELSIIEQLASLYQSQVPVATLIGFGIQRSKNGWAAIRSINSLVAVTGNLHRKHGGVYFAHMDVFNFPLNLYNLPEKSHPTIKKSREIDISNFPNKVSSFIDPPLKMLWIASRNVLAQDQNLDVWKELFQDLELVVTVDLFMTETAKQSDLVLPAMSHFEEADLNVGYWHYWLSLNEKSISPYFEAKSDLQIARELTRKLNELSPGFSTFPSDREPEEWIEMELSEEIKELYGLSSVEDLRRGSHQRKPVPWGASNSKGEAAEDSTFFSKNMGFRFFVPDVGLSERIGFDESGVDDKGELSFRLFTPQSLLRIHSQFELVSWLHSEEEGPVVGLNVGVADQLGVRDGSFVEVYNEFGVVKAKVRLSKGVPRDMLVVNQSGRNSINQLIGRESSVDVWENDVMFDHVGGDPVFENGEGNRPSSVYYYDTYVGLKKWDERIG
ncbi:molybdopterin-dependent oxidoreductase [Bacillaceae bacterium S4-13-58]